MFKLIHTKNITKVQSSNEKYYKSTIFQRKILQKYNLPTAYEIMGLTDVLATDLGFNFVVFHMVCVFLVGLSWMVRYFRDDFLCTKNITKVQSSNEKYYKSTIFQQPMKLWEILQQKDSGKNC
jgi:hypothetical protein